MTRNFEVVLGKKDVILALDIPKFQGIKMAPP
jgi:hypothetical protein